MANHDGDVYDPFLGSGTTLIAAERTGRTCYGIEIDPTYADVCRQQSAPFCEGDLTTNAAGVRALLPSIESKSSTGAIQGSERSRPH